jgi:hypothetical protein
MPSVAIAPINTKAGRRIPNILRSNSVDLLKTF